MKTYDLNRKQIRIYRTIMYTGAFAVVAVAAMSWNKDTVLGLSRRAVWALPVAACLLLAEGYLTVVAYRTGVVFTKNEPILRRERPQAFRWNVFFHLAMAALMAASLGVGIWRLLSGAHVV